jgi:ADP-L-glycero-D-manno-heptose 6-epimerase
MNDIVVVTGGAGFIGSNILAGLETEGRYRLVCCDLFGDGGKWRNVAKRRLHDVVPPDRLTAWLDSAEGAEVRAIVHMGAISDTTARDVDKVLAQNFSFTRALWRWASRRQTAFIYASSAATYGDGTQGFDDDPAAEALARLRPLNPYGWSKHLFDRFAAAEIAAGHARPAQHVGLKFFNVYGPNEYHKGGQRSVAHQIQPIAARGEAFALFKSHRAGIADGGQLRDFVWVGDCVQVVLWLLANPQVNGLFNIGSGKARSFLDLARAVYAANGRDADIVFRDMPAELRDHYQYFTEARLERLRAVGYAREFLPLEEGIRRYVQDFLLAADAHA